LLAGDIPRPLKNASKFHPTSDGIFAKKLPLDGGFTLEEIGNLYKELSH
jgi:hypothetical protein